MNHSTSRSLQMVVTALLLAVPMTAAAQLDVDIYPGPITVPRGGNAQFHVTIENRTDDTIHLNGISSTLTPDYAAEDVYDLFGAFGPDTLGPGEGWEGPLLLVTIAAEAPIQTETFGVNLTGGAHPYDDADLATFYFTVEVANPTSEVPAAGPVPDPAGIRATPNPFAGRTTLQLNLDQSRVVDVRVFDVTGRAVRNLFAGELATGHHLLEWDGLDDAGVRSHHGIYFIRVRSDGLTLTTKVVQFE